MVISDQTAIFCSPVCFCPENALVHPGHYYGKLTWLFLCVLFVFCTVCANKTVGFISARDCTLLATVSNVHMQQINWNIFPHKNYCLKSSVEIRKIRVVQCASLISLIVLPISVVLNVNKTKYKLTVFLLSGKEKFLTCTC